MSGNLEHRDAGRRSLVRPGYTAGVKEKHASLLFVARHMGVAVQKDIDIFGRLRRWDMNEAEADSVSFQVDRQRPIEIGVAIPAHES